MGPRQQAQQLKKQWFNKTVNDFAANKALFFLCVRHPRLMTPEGILHLVEELKNNDSPEYAEIVRVSSKQAEELSELKRQRDHMRSTFKRGKLEHDRDPNSKIGALWASGELEKRLKKAEADYDNRRTAGVAALMQC